MIYRLLVSITICSCFAPVATALDHVTLRRDGREQQVAGKLVVTAEDGGLLVLAADGTLWSIPPDQIVAHTTDDVPFASLTRKQMGNRLLGELPRGFAVYTTAHYIICYNTSRSYAQWCGALYERLYRAFTNDWRRRGFDMQEPELPLAVIVFADEQEYRRHAKDELGASAGSIIGYYSLRTNRVTMYDLSGVAVTRRQGSRRGSAAEINQVLARPEALPLVATIIHEATHQIAYNGGLQTRYADNPLWVSEGLAVYYETPDLKSSKGWRGIGGINWPRLETFRGNLARRPAGSLGSLIADDRRLRDGGSAVDAYAEAWALNYFLIRQRPKQYVAYLKMLSKKPRLVWDEPETRLAEFKQFFGNDLNQFEVEFLREMRKVR